MNQSEMLIIAHIRSGFKEKFGIPRQSGLVPGTKAEIVFEKEYQNPDAVRGLEGCSHIWLLWLFSENENDPHKLTVRPPRLGGNTRLGVFATRSPFRPNPIGLSCVKLESIDLVAGSAPVLTVSGADLLDGTPIIDIKPYLAFTDAHPEAVCPFADEKYSYKLTVSIPEEQAKKLAPSRLETLVPLLEQDPRPSYQNDSQRVYGMIYEDHEIKFTVDRDTLTVIGIIPL